MTINFDMDGTLCATYNVDGWLNDLVNESVRPYVEAKPLVNMRVLAKLLNRLIAQGVKVNIISWTAKNGSNEYNCRVAEAKKQWLEKYLGTVNFNKIMVVPYGTPKYTLADGILFDDEIGNRKAWGANAFDVDNIIKILRVL